MIKKRRKDLAKIKQRKGKEPLGFKHLRRLWDTGGRTTHGPVDGPVFLSLLHRKQEFLLQTFGVKKVQSTKERREP